MNEVTLKRIFVSKFVWNFEIERSRFKSLKRIFEGDINFSFMKNMQISQISCIIIK